MYEALTDIKFFQSSKSLIPLCNLLSSTTKIDSHAVQDLLSITKVGIERMKLFITEYILPPPNPGPRKRRKRTRKLATFSRKSSTASETKRREKELSEIAKNAMTILQANGIAAQTCAYPLAIADINGRMRSSQKSHAVPSNTLSMCTV